MHQADVCNPRFKDEYPFRVAVSPRSGLLPRATNRALHFARSASPSVVPPHRVFSTRCAGRAASRSFERRCDPSAGSALTSLSRSASGELSSSRSRLPSAKGQGRVHRVSVKEPQLVRPEMPSILEKPFSGSAPIARLCRRVPVPGVPLLSAVARSELAARPPARPRPGLRLDGRRHSPTSAIVTCTGTPAIDPSLPRSEPVKGSSRCASRVTPRSSGRRRGKRSRSSAGAEAPPRRPRARRVSVRAAADRPARRTSDTSWSPRRPTHGAGDAGIESPLV